MNQEVALTRQGTCWPLMPDVWPAELREVNVCSNKTPGSSDSDAGHSEITMEGDKVERS